LNINSLQPRPQLVFHEDGHRYTLGGVPIPGVTRVLESAGLINYDFLPTTLREQCIARGRAVHRATEWDDRGILSEDSVSADVLGYLRGWRSFRRDFGFLPDQIECMVYHRRLHYCGTLDRVGMTRRGDTFVIDIKTGSAPSWTAIQLAGYCACLASPRKHLRRCVELHDGSYKVIPYQTSDYQRDFSEFLAALEIYRAKEEK
jgi:hypothetical protein